MTKFLIREAASGGMASAQYRGVQLPGPDYFDELPETHPINQAFLRWVENAGDSGGVDHLEIARQYVGAATMLSEAPKYEIVEATDEYPILGTTALFLGVDAARGFSVSLIADLLSPVNSADDKYDTLSRYHGPGAIAEYNCLCNEFRPTLNRNGLFPNRETAERFLERARELDSRYPGFLEGDGVASFRPVALSALKDT